MLAVSIGVAFFALGVLAGTLSVTHGLVFALGVIVANVPEGLLPTLTLALALGVQRLAREGSVVKRLSAVEELGAATVICTDKTGTSPRTAWRPTSPGWRGGTFALDRLGCAPPAETAHLFEAAVLASHATVERGDPTEVALVVAAAAMGMEIEKGRRTHELLVPYPFDSFRKRMTLVRATDGGATAYVKGAPRETLTLCTAVRWNAHTRPLTDELRASIIASVFRAGLFTNRLVLAGIAAEIAILVGFILVPPFPAIFGLAPLSFAEWSLLLTFPPTVLLLEEARKWIVRLSRERGLGSTRRRGRRNRSVAQRRDPGLRER